MSSGAGDLRERIEKVRDRAAYAGGGRPRWEHPDGRLVLATTQDDVLGTMRHVATADFIAAHDPASVIAACDADLALLDKHFAESAGRTLTPTAAEFRHDVFASISARYPAGGGEQ